MTRHRIIIIVVASLIMSGGFGCNNETTELAWINDTGAPINDIIWANGDETWSTSGGYLDQSQTESKEVEELSGTIVASIDDGVVFTEGTVIISETNSGSLSLNAGSSEVYTIGSVIPPP